MSIKLPSIAALSILIAVHSPSAFSQIVGQGPCGDCNEDGFASSVLDALSAARIDAGLVTPTAFQTVNCDVNDSGSVDVIDALLIAQYAVGLPVIYLCPMTMNLVNLGTASTFGAFGGSAGITNQGLQTVIGGDIGTTAVSTAVTGLHDVTPGCIYTETPLNMGFVDGLIYTAPPPPTVACPLEGTAVTFAIATQARADALAAYNFLAAMPPGADPGAGSLANLTLPPGVYTSVAGSFIIEGGDLTLDAQGDPNALWVFQMATSLTVGGPGAAFPQSIILIGGAQSRNVFWQVGSAATINAGGGGTMEGTIIAQAGAAISTPGNTMIVTLNGRVLSLGAAVMLVDTVINIPAP